MSIRKRTGSPYWWYDFSHRGRRFRGSTGKTSRAEARAEEARIRARIDAGDAPSDWRLGQAAGTYWTHRARGLGSAATLEYQIENILRILGKDTPLGRLSNADVARFVATRRGEVSDSSVNRELTLLRAMLRYAQDAWDQRVPALNWRAHWLREPPARDRFLSHAEYQALIHAAHRDIRPVIRFAVMTGLRRENILSLSWSQVDLDARVVRVTLKGGRRHVVQLNRDVHALLAAMRGGRGRDLRRGRVFDRTNFRKRWLSAVKAAGLDDLRFHDLRHTFASWARMAGADIADIRDALGHSDISMTMRYAHIRPGHRASAFDLAADMAQSPAQSDLKSLKDGDK